MLAITNKGTENLMRVRKIGMGILLGIAAAQSHAFAASSFIPPVDFSVAAGGQSDIALGDLDGDGKPDAVLANYFGGGVTVFRNTSTSGVVNASSFASGVALATGGVPLHIILADFDSDSRLDIVCVNQGSGTISVLRNTASSGAIDTNSFAAKVDLNTANDPRWAAAGDYNGDGKLDLAVSCYGSGALSIFQNNSTVGTITFGSRVDLGFNAAAGDMEAGDIDGDGKPELLVPSANAAVIWVYPNVSTGGALSAASFGPRVSFPSGNGASLALADMDGDGKLDIVTANASDNSVSVFRNTSALGVIASNSLAPRVDFAAGYYPFRPAVSDINGDGRLDVAVPNSGHDSISVFLNLSSSGVFTADSFAPKTDHATGNDPRTLAIADLDGDGLADMANAILLQSSFSVLRQQTNSPPVVTNAPGTLVSLWRAEGDAQDSIGSNHGTLMGGAGFAAGAVGQGFLLDGVNDYIRVPDSASLHLSNELTLEMWFKRADNSSMGSLIDKRSLNNCNYGLIMSDVWGLQLYYNAGNGFQISFSPMPSAGAFHHLVGTFRQVNPTQVELKTYVDGQLTQSSTLPGNLANTFNGTALAIGTDRDGAGGSNFRGIIDEVAIYNYALTASQVQSNFSSVTPPEPEPPAPPATPAVVSQWRGENNAQDAVGSNHGTLMGGAGFAPGVSGQGFLLDGVNDYIRVPDSASLHLSNELTLEMWFKREDAGSYGALIDKRNWSKCNFGVIMSDVWGLQLYYNTGSGFQISFSAIPAPGVFHHFAGTFRQVNSGQVELKTYINGQLARTDTLPGNLANTFNGDALSIGVDRDGAGGSFFRGIVDEVTIYNYALTASQVYSNYVSITPPVIPPTTNTSTTNSTGSLIALWHGDGNAQDSVGSNHGTLIGGAAFSSGVAGQGFLLDGVNDYIRVPDSATLHLAGEFTVEMWFKREDSSSYGALIDKRNWNNCNFGLLMSPDWGLQLYYNDPSVSVGNTFEISFSSIPPAGVFHHLAGTFRQFDSNHVEVKTYVDGQLVRSDTLPGNLNTTFNNNALAIGCDRDGAGGSFFRGIIDEVALYNYALSPSQISSNFNGLAISAPQIIAQPTNQTVVQGDAANFIVGAIGAAPLQYQWHFAGNLLGGETNSSLNLASAQPTNTGAYYVVVANNAGSITSAVATLTISQSGLAPSFVSEPLVYYSGAAGTTITLNANASGTPVLLYQWTFNGVAIPGATGSSLVLSNIQSENVGTYRLIVSNDFGSIVSSGSGLNVSVPGGGTLNFQNSSTGLVYYPNGTETVPTGAGFVAALYAGTNSDGLLPVGGTAVFVVPGRFLGGTRSVPLIAPGQQAQIQVRVWNSTVAATYEEAVALGGQHGASSVFSVTLGGGIMPPPSLSTMPSFSLTAGTGVAARRKILSANPASVMLSSFNRSGGAYSFILTGTPGATLAIEVSTDLVNWTVADYVINSSGAQTYLDQMAGPSGQRFYRARVIAP
jgi:hypothetical protein